MGIFRRRRLETNLEREARIRRERAELRYRRGYSHEEPVYVPVVVPVEPILVDSDYDGVPDIIDATPYGHHHHDVVIIEDHHDDVVVVDNSIDYGYGDSYIAVDDYGYSSYDSGSYDSGSCSSDY